MAKDMFSYGEEKVLEKLPTAVKNVEGKLDLANLMSNKNGYNDILPFSQMNTGNEDSNRKSYVRVLTGNDNGRPSVNTNSYPVEDNVNNYAANNNYGINDNSNVSIGNNNAANSFVLILAALIALVLIIFVVTTGILNIIGY